MSPAVREETHEEESWTDATRFVAYPLDEALVALDEEEVCVRVRYTMDPHRNVEEAAGPWIVLAARSEADGCVELVAGVVPSGPRKGTGT